jgi:hypothetical protein
VTCRKGWQKKRQTFAELGILGVKALTPMAVKQRESGKCREWPGISVHDKRSDHSFIKVGLTARSFKWHKSSTPTSSPSTLSAP